MIASPMAARKDFQAGWKDFQGNRKDFQARWKEIQGRRKEIQMSNFSDTINLSMS
jgi:hypothetical protein